jgi:RNA recognition motif-containing protein
LKRITGNIMGTKLRVGNLPSSATADDLLVKFGQFGVVESAQILRDERTGQISGTGLVSMANDADAKIAITRLNFSQYGDLTMSVSAAREKDTA